ncbi:MAG: sigma-54-dependent Fis family transcriptional regulator [Hyphomicrobiaceae bacterium]|nr:sigma-54-dependent Fis family transcriptional regulator [Hyphomicrobiaceae bacterium]
MPDQILIVEDEALLGNELARHYRRNGWEVVVVATVGEAERLLASDEYDPLLIISDLNLPDGNGLDLLQNICKTSQNTAEWIFLTGYGEAPDAVKAMRLGAFDFLTKPADMGRLDLVIAGATRSAKAQRRISRQARHEGRRYQPESYIGQSTAAENAREMLRRLAGLPFSGLIINGETGTGKGLTAKILHHSSPRADAPFVEVNCAALPRDLLESELFGHEAGAFTGAKGKHVGLMEQASGGTLFLDEIAEMDISLQPKLLKAIEDKTIRRLGGEREIKIEVQVIAATNRDLAEEMRQGRFRQDLYHRLSVFEISLPALRQRPEDISELVLAFIDEFNALAKKKVRQVPEKIWAILEAYSWPGNVRELRNVIERAVLLSTTDALPLEWIQLQQSGCAGPSQVSAAEGDWVHLPLDGTMALDDMDRFIIETALKRHDYNVMATARALGTTRETLRYRVQKYGLLREKSRDKCS